MKKEMKEEGDQNPKELLSGVSNLRRAIDLISFLLSISHSIKTFPVKWQSIRNKLEELYSGLTTAENCNSGENSSLSSLISSILSTVGDCYNLARLCLQISYSGRLLMQSDLDIISVKFDLQLKELTGIYTAGILTRDCAIVVSRPGPSATREDMKFYIRDLLNRMKIGSTEMKNQALIGLNEVLKEDEKYVNIVVELSEIIVVLASFLEFTETEIQEESAEAISAIVSFNSCRSVLVGAGIVAPLIHVLENGSDLGKEKAAKALQKLTENSDNTWSVSAHGGVPILLKICSNGNVSGELMCSACGLLKNLAGVDEIKKFMVEEGVISTFVGLSRSKDEVLQIRAIEFLQTMASGDQAIQMMVVKEGGISSLVRILDPNSSYSSKAREIALRAIETFCFSSMNSVNILMSYGFLDLVLFLLKNGEVTVQESALKALFFLSRISDESKKEIGGAGFIQELVKLLDSKSFEIREMAAEALSSLVSVPRNRRKFVHEDSNIDHVLELLDPDEKYGDKKYLLSMLMSSANSNSGRRKIAASGNLKHLERLAETEVIEAKRIVKKVSENRFRSLWSGVWHS
ncbi:ARM repeat superfamily protein [Tasmannia lanceolata]|uniref:ARM repeat superfamily protein n=1 Tax=Tasmannia lanceolata TaxID=3420 RepID=UPI0040634218